MDTAAFASRRSEWKYQRMSQQELGAAGEGQEEGKGPVEDKERLKKRKNKISNDVQELQKTLAGVPQDQEGSHEISLNKPPPTKNSGVAVNLQEGVIKGPKSKVDSASKIADKESDSVISKSSSAMYLKSSPTVTLKMEPGTVART
jgi:hypothetical protein